MISGLTGCLLENRGRGLWVSPLPFLLRCACQSGSFFHVSTFPNTLLFSNGISLTEFFPGDTLKLFVLHEHRLECKNTFPLRTRVRASDPAKFAGLWPQPRKKLFTWPQSGAAHQPTCPWLGCQGALVARARLSRSGSRDQFKAKNTLQRPLFCSSYSNSKHTHGTIMSPLILKLPSLIFHLSISPRMTHRTAGRCLHRLPLNCVRPAPGQGLLQVHLLPVHPRDPGEPLSSLQTLFTIRAPSPTLLFHRPRKHPLMCQRKNICIREWFLRSSGPTSSSGQRPGTHRSMSSSSSACCRTASFTHFLGPFFLLLWSHPIVCELKQQRRGQSISPLGTCWF